MSVALHLEVQPSFSKGESYMQAFAPCSIIVYRKSQLHLLVMVIMIPFAKIRKVEHKTKKLVSFFVETEYLRHL